MEIKSNLPENVIGYTDFAGMTYCSDGSLFPTIFKGKKPYNNLFVAKNGNVIILGKIHPIVNDSMILFDFITLLSFSFDQFGEMDIIEQKNNFRFEDFTTILSSAANNHFFFSAFYEQIKKLEQNEEICLSFPEANCEIILFVFFKFRLNKQVSLIFDHHLESIIFSSKFAEAAIKNFDDSFRITAEFIEVYEILSKDETTNIVSAATSIISLLQTEDVQTVKKAVVVLQNIQHQVHWCLAEIADIIQMKKCSLRDLMNYILYKHFNTTEIANLTSMATLKDYLILLKDYMQIIDNENNLVPESHKMPCLPKEKKTPLKKLHDETIANRNVSETMAQYLHYEEEFVKAVSQKGYQALKMQLRTTDGTFSFEIPNTAKDLIKESMVMDNCVQSYIPQVAKGTTKIVFLRQKEKSLATIEVKDKKIRQAYRKGNSSLTQDLRMIIKQWAKENKIEYVI